MRRLFTYFIFLIFPFYLNAQKTVIWRGGAPGQEKNWTVGDNWSTNHIPWSDDIVIIPNLDTQGQNYPVINSRVPRIGALVIRDKAELTVTENGLLEIDGSWNNTYGIHLVGSLVNLGIVRIIDSGLEPLFIQGGAKMRRGDFQIMNIGEEDPFIAEKTDINQ